MKFFLKKVRIGILIISAACQSNGNKENNSVDTIAEAPVVISNEAPSSKENTSSNSDLSKLELELISLLPTNSGMEENFEKNKSFKDKLISILEAYPSSMDFAFDSLQKSYVSVLTSPDANFRVYCWDTYTGGTMHFFERVYQFKSNGATKISIPVLKEGVPGSLAQAVYSDTLNGKKYYLVKDMGIFSTRDRSEVITIFKINEQGKIEEAKKFKTPKKELSSINISYDAFNSAENGINYDYSSREVRIPLVNEKFQATTKSIIYKADGMFWVYSGVR
jgi:hypothetical protein